MQRIKLLERAVLMLSTMGIRGRHEGLWESRSKLRELHELIS
jgi:hypothetical protein